MNMLRRSCLPALLLPLALLPAASADAGDDPSFAGDAQALVERIGPLRMLRVYELSQAPDACEASRVIVGQPAAKVPPIACVAGEGPPRCVLLDRGWTAKDGITEASIAALCAAEAPKTTAPDWLPAATTFLEGGRSMQPFDDGSGLLLSDAIGLTFRIAVRHADRWSGGPWAVPGEYGTYARGIRSVDASRLLGEPARAIIGVGYDGGSGFGTRFTDVDIYRIDGAALTRIGGVPVGRLAWAMSPEQRRAAPKAAAWDLRARPHDEVQAKWRIERGALIVSAPPAKPCRALRKTAAADPDEAPYGVEVLLRVCDAAGRWQVRDGALVKQGAAEASPAPEGL